eukprot:NODE_735_length_1384_cov_395.483146_g556_i0.p1 GENE.NODE_735_length_1384_cov_395.483146_g556_i0~~NODE_735_length_1384_cov_395.483146_g556_i0.p1  ORF type:complete len:285 (-),score=57.62 NODE_735_length_1384_cov_395.483146_g556_i0:529-1317(-)
MSSQWLDAPEPAIKHEYNLITGIWSTKDVTVALSACPFQQGTMRVVHHLRDCSAPLHQQECVAKFAKNPNEGRQTYFTEVEMQAKCKALSTEFNNRKVCKRIDFIVACVVEFPRRRAPNGGPLMAGVEPFLNGKYVKHSNNYGYVAPENDATAAAFSHFTYCLSSGKLLVCDIQGVGEMFTDPQIHSNEPNGVFRFGQGDMGLDGIQKFFNTHQCNSLCTALRLAPNNVAPPATTRRPLMALNGVPSRRLSLKLKPSGFVFE